jgi:hypothetical protein
VAARALGVVELVSGIALTVRPAAIARAVTRTGGTVPATWLVRVLGARSLLQGAVTLARPTRDVLAAGSAIDALHAASMLPVVVGLPRHRRAAAASAAVAASTATAGLLCRSGSTAAGTGRGER